MLGFGPTLTTDDALHPVLEGHLSRSNNLMIWSTATSVDLGAAGHRVRTTGAVGMEVAAAGRPLRRGAAGWTSRVRTVGSLMWRWTSYAVAGCCAVR